jgi:type IV secretory pathway TraG/TraD family ATPase VirD4
VTQYTISANIAYLRPIAALWQKATRRFSLQEWIDGNSILVLGNSETLRTPIDAINRAIFQRLVELVLAQSESSTRRTWFFLDELKEMGRLDGLPSLLTKGRSKGARAVLAFQTIEGLRAVYGDRLANEICGMCANKLLLRTDSPETAQWASSVIGEAETLRWMRSHQSSKNGKSESASQQITTTQAVLASELLRLPLANRECFHSFCVVPAIGIWRDTTPFARDLRPKGTAANFIPRPDSDQYPSFSPPDDEQGGLDDITRMTWRNAPQPPEPDL